MLSSPLKHPSLNSVWLVTELCYENHSWTIFSSFYSGCSVGEFSNCMAVREQKPFLSETDDDASPHNQLNLINIPDFCVWTFSVRSIQDHKAEKKKYQKNPVRESTNIDCRENSWKEIPQEHDKKKFQDISENRNIFVPCQPTPILLRQIHLTCADKANAQLPLVWILYNHMDAFKMR